MKNVNLHIQETQPNPLRINLKRSMPRHIVKPSKPRAKRTWNVAKEKQLICKMDAW